MLVLGDAVEPINEFSAPRGSFRGEANLMLSNRSGHVCGSRFVRILTGLTTATFLASCSELPFFQDTVSKSALNSSEPQSRIEKIAAVAWWQDFQDPALDSLVIQGLGQNLDLLQTLERVRRAEAVVRGSGITLSDDGTNSASGERRGDSRTSDFTTSQVGFGASWLIDIFGLARSERTAALRDLDAASASSQAARMIFLSQITGAYVELRFFEGNIRIKKEDAASRRRTLKETQSMFDLELATKLDISRAQGLLSSTLLTIPILEADAQRQRNRIATLLGVQAGTMELSIGKNQPVPRAPLPEVIPADLIRNRPDVRVAEHNYEAQVARVGVAKAELNPSLTLDGTIEASRVSGNSFSTWSFGPTLYIPIFNRGVLKANIDVADSDAKESHLVWRKSILDAVEEVENALYSIKKYESAVSNSRNLVRYDAQSLEFSRELAQRQEITLLELIETERNAAIGREAHARNLRRLALEFVALNVALGSGYAVGMTDEMTLN
jgi:multidrug efflux system outer membrane protein